MLKELIIGLVTLLAVQVNAGTTIEVEPGEVFTVRGVGSTATVIHEEAWLTSLPTGTTQVATNVTIKKTCTKEDLHKLLYQARQHLPRRQGESMLTVTTLQSVFEKESDKLRRKARELDAYDEWIDILDKAVDKDECN